MPTPGDPGSAVPSPSPRSTLGPTTSCAFSSFFPTSSGPRLAPGVTLTNWEMEDAGTESNSANGQSPALRPQGSREPGSGASRSPVYPGTTPLPPGPFLPRVGGGPPAPAPEEGGKVRKRGATRSQARGPNRAGLGHRPAGPAAASDARPPRWPQSAAPRGPTPPWSVSTSPSPACLPADRGLRSQRLRPGAAAAAAECASPPGAGPGAMPRAQSPVAARRGESSAECRPYFARERDFWRGLGWGGGT